jgi:indole-3-glycerol phosphate synthase
MTNILDAILAQKWVEIAALDLPGLRRLAEGSPPPRNFMGAVSRRQNRPLALIAEIKRASPSKGVLAPHLDVFRLADTYIQNGAAAISVLTDAKFFQGSLETLRELRFTRRSPLPFLRKDFILDEAQVYETRACGADAILLIAAALQDEGRLAALHRLAQELGLAALVEVHDEAETERALALSEVRLIGINNRSLANFDTSLATTERLRPRIPPGICVIAESGIFTAADVSRLSEARVDAILVGEALVTAANIGAKVRELSGTLAEPGTIP